MATFYLKTLHEPVACRNRKDSSMLPLQDLVVRHDSYKIGQALAFERTSHRPLRTHAATQYVI